jgi:hypothetical protein
VKQGDDHEQQKRVARSLGRIAWCDRDGENCVGFVLAMELSQDATFAYERWINPDDITAIFDAPTAMAAFFFAAELPYSPDMIRRLLDYGTVSDRYVNNAAARVEAWASGGTGYTASWQLP